MPFFPKNTGGSGGSTFNGGTITQPLVIDTPGVVGFVNESELISPGGMTFQNGTAAVQRFAIVSPTIDATVAQTIDIFISPSGFNMLVDNEAIVITASITTPGATPATVSIGDSVHGTGFYFNNLACPQAASSTVDSSLEVFWYGNGQNIIGENTQVTITVSTPSTAASQTVYIVLQGILLPI